MLDKIYREIKLLKNQYKIKIKYNNKERESCVHAILMLHNFSILNYESRFNFAHLLN